MRLTQVQHSGKRAVAATADGGKARLVTGASTLYEIAQRGIARGLPLGTVIGELGLGGEIDLREALDEGCVLPPIDHPDPAHLFLTGTGLTHLGSADARDRMHRKLADPAQLTDTMKMFRLGLEGGKPAPGHTGVQPEWFYKGNGFSLAAPEAALISPGFALDGGEEPEIAGIYLIGPDGAPWRLGFALANEFSDHVMERQNYLYLAHSKLRPASIGPELLTGPLPSRIEGTSRIRRGGQVVWEKPFLSGEDNMSHSIANLEQHHFKYDLFRRPGDIHVHFFGTATISFGDGVKAEAGDRFEIEAAPFGLPLRNVLAGAPEKTPAVRAL